MGTFVTGVGRYRWLLAVLVSMLGSVLTAQPAAASISNIGAVVQEPGDYEARFPDIVKLDDGRLMAVWHKATEHSGVVGTIRLSFSGDNGLTWTAATSALANPDTMAGVDTRDPKLGKMNDGSVILTFFVPGGKVYYSVWKPGWHYFTDPVRLTAPGQSLAMYEHGGVLALADNGTQVNQVLIPFYVPGTAGGVYFLRATWNPALNPALTVTGTQKMMNNDNPVGRVYSEPSFVQIGGTVVTIVRATQDGAASPCIVIRFDPYAATTSFTYQYFTGVLASSQHLLKTSSGQVLFTYGDAAQTHRPTVGMLISNPTSTWVAGKVVGIYNSGADDQANPSSVETTAGTFLTLGYNAKPKTVSSYGGTLWVLQSHTADY